MLHALETLLHAAIDAALPGSVDVVAGPYEPAGKGAVVVHARGLDLVPPPPVAALAAGPAGSEGAAGGEDDDPAHLVELATWSADGSTQDFEIPGALTGELMEVESPPGITVRPGDAYYADGRTIRFYQPPRAAAEAVRARLRGDPARGWRRRRRCVIRLDIAAWAQSTSDADQRLETALHTALAALVDAPNLDAGQVAGADVWMRVLAPRPYLVGLQRGMDRTANLVHASAELAVGGELDLIVARGAPAPEGIIEGITGSVAVQRGDGDAPVPEPFAVGAGAGAEVLVRRSSLRVAASSGASGSEPAGTPSGPPFGPRPIAGRPVDMLAGVGRVASQELAGLRPPVTALGALAALDADAVAADLDQLTTTQVRVFAHQAALVLSFPALPSLPAAALSAPLSTLVTLAPADLAARTGLGTAHARMLLGELLSLRLLLNDSALSQLTLADYTPA